MKYYINKKKYIEDERGIGHLSKYKPWLNVRSFPSRGRVTRIRGTKTNRTHHLMSDLELKYFYILEWDKDITDIREQFPLLDTSETFEIAQRKGIKHPINRYDKSLNVLTTDFMITKKVNGKEFFEARTIKYAKDLNNNRVIELFEIEREYWESKGIDWGIITEIDIPKVVVDNIAWVHKASSLDNLIEGTNMNRSDFIKILNGINEEIYIEENKDKRLLELIVSQDNRYNLQQGTSLYLFRYGIFNKIINVNMNKVLRLSPYIKDILI